jgi:N-acyl-D-aspartate/D-glutamate deacylase
MLDTVIKGGLLIDGTGSEATRVDVGVKNGRVAFVGTDAPQATNVVDADGMVVAPGFIDVHTHYDAQVLWDPALTPSCFHGVTTVVGGNCGFTVAPVNEESRDYILHMLACVEGMPPESLEESLSWNWESFADWLEVLDRRVAVNTAFSVGHSTVRRLVMGDDWRRPASDDEITAMARLVDESLDAGAIGFSSSWGEAHGDHQGDPVPSRFADTHELVRLAARLQGRPGTMLEFIPSVQPCFPDEAAVAMTEMAVAAGRPLNWNVISVGTQGGRSTIQQRLATSDLAAAKGARLVALTLPVPVQLRLNLLTSIAYNQLPAWSRTLALPFEDRLTALGDPETRRLMAADVAGKEDRIFLNFAPMTVESVVDPDLADLVGRTLGDIAAERDRSPFDTFLDIAVADRLRTCFSTPRSGDDEESWRLRAELWKDPRTLIGASDAGAHLDMLASFGYFTELVGPLVRDRKLLEIEEAVHHLTGAPSDLYGLVDRGRIYVGAHADIVVFDPETVGSRQVVLRRDMPGDQSRLYAESDGIAHVIVNGTEIVRSGELTGACPGTVLRGGRDTR